MAAGALQDEFEKRLREEIAHGIREYTMKHLLVDAWNWIVTPVYDTYGNMDRGHHWLLKAILIVSFFIMLAVFCGFGFVRDAYQKFMGQNNYFDRGFIFFAVVGLILTAYVVFF